MPSRVPERRLRDVLINIARVRDYTAGLDAPGFARDQKTQDAVERCLERISEAARKIGDALDRDYPEVEFHKLRQLGSVLRHDYEFVDAGELWRTITLRLSALEAACQRELGARRSDKKR